MDCFQQGYNLRIFFSTVKSKLSGLWVAPQIWRIHILTGHGGFSVSVLGVKENGRVTIMPELRYDPKWQNMNLVFTNAFYEIISVNIINCQ